MVGRTVQGFKLLRESRTTDVVVCAFMPCERRTKNVCVGSWLLLVVCMQGSVIFFDLFLIGFLSLFLTAEGSKVQTIARLTNDERVLLVGWLAVVARSAITSWLIVVGWKCWLSPNSMHARLGFSATKLYACDCSTNVLVVVGG